MSHSHHCLNCNAPLKGAYCKDCGQKSATHRLSFMHFIQHDLVHGLFHLDKGILHTLKELIYRPGFSAREYIAGKRVKHYSIFAFFIIVLALRHYMSVKLAGAHDLVTSNDKITDEKLNHVINNYYKFLYLAIIPLLSLITYLFIRRPKYNFTEHVVMNAFLLSGVFFYYLVFMVLLYFVNFIFLDYFGIAFIILYLMIGYYQVVKGIYPFWNYLWRGLVILILFILVLFVGFIFLIVAFYGGSFVGSIHT